jgi:hypothetical protein
MAYQVILPKSSRILFAKQQTEGAVEYPHCSNSSRFSLNVNVTAVGQKLQLSVLRGPLLGLAGRR